MSRRTPSAGCWMRLGAFCLLAGLYLAWAICDVLTDLGGDSATYMLTARTLSPFLVVDPIVVAAVAGSPYPPLFPLLIGLFGGSLWVGHVVVTISLLLAILFFYFWLRVRGLGAGLACAAVALFAFQPGTYRLVLNIWSESTYLCLSLLVLLAVDRTPNSTRPQRWWWIAVAAAAAAVMTRAAALPLMAVLTAYIVWRRPSRWPAMILVGWAPFAAWSFWSWLHSSGVSLYALQLQHIYGQELLPHLHAQLTTQGQALAAAWFESWLAGPALPALTVVVAVFGCLACIGWLVGLWQLRFDALYCITYLFALLTHPWPSEVGRLLYVIMPIFVFYGIAATLVGARRWGARVNAAVTTTVVTAVGLALLPNLVISAQRRIQQLPPDIDGVKHLDSYYGAYDGSAYLAVATLKVLTDIPGLAQHVPRSACVFSIKAPVVTLLTGLESHTPPPKDVASADFERMLARCDYAYLTRIQSPSFPGFYPRERLRDRFQVLTSIATPDGQELAELVALHPAETN